MDRKKAEDMTNHELARYVDHAVMNPDLTISELRECIQIGVDSNCRSVRVNSGAIDIAKDLIYGTTTEICVALDFPFGTSSRVSKVAQAKAIVEEGGISEIAMVANYGLLKSGNFRELQKEMEEVATICHAHQVGLEVILETDALTKQEINVAIMCAIEATVDFVNTSTGYYDGENNVGASPEIIKLMLHTSNQKIKVKVSGCIHTKERMFELINLGVERLGVEYTSTKDLL